MGDGKMDELKGKAKEAVGAVRNDDEQRREGQADQSKGKLKQARREGQGRRRGCGRRAQTQVAPLQCAKLWPVPLPVTAERV